MQAIQSSFERVALVAHINRSSLDSSLYRFAAQVQPNTPRMSFDSLKPKLSRLDKDQSIQRGHDH